MNNLAPVLAGTRILLTAQRRAEELAGALERRGAMVRITPTLGVVSNIDEDALLARTRQLIAEPVDAVVITTGIGFRGWVDTVEAAGMYDDLIDALRETRLIARGPKARGALQAAGLKADWVAESETSTEILDRLLAEGVDDARIAIQRHGAGDPSFEAKLAAGGACVVPLEVYRWGPPPDPEGVTDAALAVAAGEYDAVLFTSAPAAQAFLRELEVQGLTQIVRDRVGDGTLLITAVGPVTGDPLTTAGLRPICPDRSRMGALVRLVITSLGEVPGVATPEGMLRIRASAATLEHEVLPLSPTGLAVLRRLAREPGRVVTREQLLDALPGKSSDPHTAEVAVARLRDSIAPRQLVRTVIKRGYMLLVS